MVDCKYEKTRYKLILSKIMFLKIQFVRRFCWIGIIIIIRFLDCKIKNRSRWGFKQLYKWHIQTN